MTQHLERRGRFTAFCCVFWMMVLLRAWLHGLLSPVPAG
jgi:hypothetical protein